MVVVFTLQSIYVILMLNGIIVLDMFYCCRRESVKPLQFYCNSLPLSYLLDERQLVFFRKLFSSNNRISRALITLPMVHYEILGLVSNGIYTVHYSTASVKAAIWPARLCFSVLFMSDLVAY